MSTSACIGSVKNTFRYTERILAKTPYAAIHFSEHDDGKRYNVVSNKSPGHCRLNDHITIECLCMLKLGEFKFTCEACGKTKFHTANLGDTFPLGWYFRRLDLRGCLADNGGRLFLLCGDCGNKDHFDDGLSDCLRERFKKRKIYFKPLS